jgi:predicted enzyme related to lactoylglutathione lyase
MDVDMSASFFQDLFGWEVEDREDLVGPFKVLRHDGLDIASVRTAPIPMFEPFWCMSIAADDVAATCARAKAAGAKWVLPPSDWPEIPPRGSVSDPTGAGFGLLPTGPAGERSGEGVDPIRWVYTAADVATALPFYQAVFGYSIVEQPTHARAGLRFCELQLGGRTVAGALAVSDWPDELDPWWLPFFVVVDTDAAVAKVADLGGALVVGPSEIPPGRFALVHDSLGGSFCVIALDPDYKMG